MNFVCRFFFAGTDLAGRECGSASPPAGQLFKAWLLPPHNRRCGLAKGQFVYYFPYLEEIGSDVGFSKPYAGMSMSCAKHSTKHIGYPMCFVEYPMCYIEISMYFVKFYVKALEQTKAFGVRPKVFLLPAFRAIVLPQERLLSSDTIISKAQAGHRR